MFIASHKIRLDVIKITVLEIIDNGKGFNPDFPHTGFGLRGMQECVDVLAGELIIKSREIKGTHIQVFISF
ncbi:MAG: hypothetical protein AAF378_00270 [Cyanobacteria bacterium P01_A01_bin.84]